MLTLAQAACKTRWAVRRGTPWKNCPKLDICAPQGVYAWISLKTLRALPSHSTARVTSTSPRTGTMDSRVRVIVPLASIPADVCAFLERNTSHFYKLCRSAHRCAPTFQFAPDRALRILLFSIGAFASELLIVSDLIGLCFLGCGRRCAVLACSVTRRRRDGLSSTDASCH